MLFLQFTEVLSPVAQPIVNYLVEIFISTCTLYFDTSGNKLKHMLSSQNTMKCSRLHQRLASFSAFELLRNQWGTHFWDKCLICCQILTKDWFFLFFFPFPNLSRWVLLNVITQDPKRLCHRICHKNNNHKNYRFHRFDFMNTGHFKRVRTLCFKSKIKTTIMSKIVIQYKMLLSWWFNQQQSINIVIISESHRPLFCII